MTIVPSSNYDDEIDLRAILQTLWKGRGLIIALTLIAALVAYAVSAWLLPKQYQAVAYATVSQPAARFNSGQDGGLTFNPPAVPDIKALPELAQADVILEQVASDPRVAPLLAGDKTQWTNNAQISAVGVSQLRFQVADTNPKRAATLATVWAEKAAEWIELNYGIGALTANLDVQIAQTQHAYAQSQSDLETFLAQDQTPALSSQLQAQTEIYACLEKRISAASSLLQRLDALAPRLTQLAAPLPLSDALLLNSVQQNVDSLETCGNLATVLPSSSPALFAVMNSSQADDVVVALRQDIQQRVENSQADQDALGKKMQKLQSEIERLNYQRAEYARQRDQSQNLYTQLTFQQSLMKSVLQQSGRVANVSAKARTPKVASSPRPMVNTAIAGILGLFLALGWTLGKDWWKNAEPRK